MSGKPEINAENLWREGEALCLKGRYRNGLALMEQAAALDKIWLKPLGEYYLLLAEKRPA